MTDTSVFQPAQPGTFADPLTDVLCNGAIARLGAAQASALCALLPGLTLLLAIPVLGEWPSPIEIACVLLIGAGVYLAAMAHRVRNGSAVPERVDVPAA